MPLASTVWLEPIPVACTTEGLTTVSEDPVSRTTFRAAESFTSPCMKTSPKMIGVGIVTGEGLCCPAQVEHRKPKTITLAMPLCECSALIINRMITDSPLPVCESAIAGLRAVSAR